MGLVQGYSKSGLRSGSGPRDHFVRTGQPFPHKIENGDVYQGKRGSHSSSAEAQEAGSRQQEAADKARNSWRRILLLILAITIHNIPGTKTEVKISREGLQ
ncbi:hypothetical protein WMY93_032532 [Mugilogobius chulae]|uniref:Uncharacterized protein n=1 Tax=Mugilogobius chulae TaxID=88201 RepID=A0AAW0ML32_9GOBI